MNARLSPVAGFASALLIAAATSSLGAQPAAAIRRVDSVRVEENDTLFVAGPTEILLAPDGNLFVSEGTAGRVLEISPNGRIARVFGRKGRGPGEYTAPSSLALGGDSLLLVWDRGQRRFVEFDLRSGAFRKDMPVSLAWPPVTRVVGREILVASYDLDDHTSVTHLSAAGEKLQTDGVIPEFGLKYPMLLGSGFGASPFEIIGGDVYAMFDLSPSLYHWKAGSRTAEEIHVPAVRRRGVKTANFERMMRDPTNQAANVELMADHSTPLVVERVAPSVLGLLTLDLRFEPEKKTQEGWYYLTLVDLARRRVCVDLDFPSSHVTIGTKDPLPRVAIAGDTLVVLVQGVDAQGRSATYIHRFRIDPARCAWAPLPK
jgi:6-bladed beta-propeller